MAWICAGVGGPRRPRTGSRRACSADHSAARVPLRRQSGFGPPAGSCGRAKRGLQGAVAGVRGPQDRGATPLPDARLSPGPPRGERAAVGAWRRIHAARVRAPVGGGVASGGVAAPHVRPLRAPVLALRPVEQRVPEPDGAWGEQPVLLRRALRAWPGVLVGHAVGVETAGGLLAPVRRARCPPPTVPRPAVGVDRAIGLIRDWLLALCWGSAAKAGATPMAATASTAALASERRVMKRFIVVSHSCCSEVSVRVQPHGSDRKDRIAEVGLHSDHGITLLWPPARSRQPARTPRGARGRV
jgi:hypothetical protein